MYGSIADQYSTMHNADLRGRWGKTSRGCAGRGRLGGEQGRPRGSIARRSMSSLPSRLGHSCRLLKKACLVVLLVGIGRLLGGGLLGPRALGCGLAGLGSLRRLEGGGVLLLRGAPLGLGCRGCSRLRLPLLGCLCWSLRRLQASEKNVISLESKTSPGSAVWSEAAGRPRSDLAY